MAKKDKKPKDPNKPKRLAQIRDAYRITRESDRWIGLILIGVFLVTFGIVFGLGLLTGFEIEGGILAFALAMLATVFVFGRRAQKAAYAQVEGRPGAAAAVLDNLRRGWTVTPVVVANKDQDVVHRAVGRPGIVLVAEGNHNRARSLLNSERRRMSRVASEVPIHEFIVGNGPDEVPLAKLSSKVMKLPRALKGPQVAEVNRRLRAMGDFVNKPPIPKGPMPKGARMPKGR